MLLTSPERMESTTGARNQGVMPHAGVAMIVVEPQNELGAEYVCCFELWIGSRKHK